MDFKNLWSCKEDFYVDCAHPVLQKAIDHIKTNYDKLIGRIERIRNDMDLHLQRRRTNDLLRRVYGI